MKRTLPGHQSDQFRHLDQAPFTGYLTTIAAAYLLVPIQTLFALGMADAWKSIPSTNSAGSIRK